MPDQTSSFGRAYRARVNEDRISDGLEIARAMIGDAYCILAAYANGDALSVRAMLDVMVHDTELSARRDHHNRLAERYLVDNGYLRPPSASEAHRSHLLATAPRVDAMLLKALNPGLLRHTETATEYNLEQDRDAR